MPANGIYSQCSAIYVVKGYNNELNGRKAMTVHAAANKRGLSPFEVLLKVKNITEIMIAGNMKASENNVVTGSSCLPMCRSTGRISMRPYSAIILGNVIKRTAIGSSTNPSGADIPNTRTLNKIKPIATARCGASPENLL